MDQSSDLPPSSFSLKTSGQEAKGHQNLMTKVKASVLTTSATPGVRMFPWERYSSCTKLVRVYAWWMRYMFKLRCKVKKQCPPSERQGKILCADHDLKEASLALCQLAQIDSFKEDYEDLQVNRALPHNSSLLPLQPMERPLLVAA